MAKKTLLCCLALFVGLVSSCGDSSKSKQREELGAVVDISFSDGTHCEVCALVADSPQERSDGLSGIDKLEGYDAMLFELDEKSGASFWMKNVRFPIDLLLVGSGGDLLARHTMPVCKDSECELYGVPDHALLALEIPHLAHTLSLEDVTSVKKTDRTCSGHMLADSAL